MDEQASNGRGELAPPGLGRRAAAEGVATSGTWTDFWVYLAGPILGAAAGAIAYEAVRGPGLATTERPDPETDGARPLRLPA